MFRFPRLDLLKPCPELALHALLRGPVVFAPKQRVGQALHVRQFFFGVMGVYYAEPIADVCSVITAVTLFLCNIRKILSTETLAKVTHTEE